MPPTYVLLLWGLKAIWCVLVFAYGACLGSLINVIVYRLPLGISIVSPPSRCPSCNTRLSWRDNIPVFGWILLRGKCRYCGKKISPEYPVVEAVVGVLFVGLFAYFYLLPSLGRANSLGVDWVREWYRNDPTQTWPTFVVLLVLMASMVAMTIIDARTFTIPPLLTTVPVVVALIVHPIHAAVVGPLPHRSAHVATPFGPAGWLWGIATPDPVRWDLIMASFGGVIGLAIAVLMVRLNWLPQSFADYAEWEDSVRAAKAASPESAAAPDVASAAVGVAAPDPVSNNPSAPSLEAPAQIPVPAADASRPPAEPGQASAESKAEIPADLWIQYPHARREMVKEILFLGPCIGLGAAGLYFGRWYWGMAHNDLLGIWTCPTPARTWLCVLAGVLLGYLIGGGVVWAVRILGSLAFGKEAMGLGDVHLMAAVGACLGWIDSVLAFLAAAFVGLAWFALGTAFSGAFRRTMPYGPYLAVATLLVVLGKPLIEAGLSRLTGQPVAIP